MKNPFLFLFIRQWERVAMQCLSKGLYDRAEEYFLKIQAVDPLRFGTARNLGLISFAQERYAEAEKHFLNDLKLFGDAFIRIKSVGDVYYVWGKREPCKEYYTRSLPLCEHESDKRQLEHRIEQCESDASFEKAIQSARCSKEGSEKITERAYDEAFDLLKQAITLDPGNFQAWNNLGVIEMNVKKNIKEAVNHFEKAALYTSLPSIQNNVRNVKDFLRRNGGNE